MNHSTLYEAYLEGYTPDRFMNFYLSLAEEFHLLANPSHAIPISHAPLVLDARFEDLFSELATTLWEVLANRPYRELCAENIPHCLRDPHLKEREPIPFDPKYNIGGIDLHLDPEGLHLIEFMVLPPGMSGIYPGMLARYQEYLEADLSEFRPRCFRGEWNRERLEDLMIENILGPSEPECVAVVDWEPENQITYGEFRYLLERIRKKKGIPGLIGDPRDVTLKGSKIRVRGEPVDRILNRVTLPDWQVHADALPAYTRLLWEAPECFAYHPYLWFLGDKGSLTLLSDPQTLEKIGLREALREKLRDLVPATYRLSDFLRPHSGTVDEQKLLHTFGSPSEIVLKPISSHASKGILFGPVDMPDAEKLEEALRRIDPENYVAMQLVAPPEIEVPRGERRRETWKYDLRVFVLNGSYVFSGGRIYLGDYTNQVPCRAFAPLFFA